jgi:hypothetical protein
VHNSSPTYVSTAGILKSIQKKFLKNWFSPQISSKPLSPQETELKRKKRKAPNVSSNKEEVNIFIGERHFNFQNPFWCDLIFSPSIIPFQKSFPKSLRKFSWLFWTILYLGNIHDSSCTLSPYPWAPHIQPIEGRMRRNICWAKVRHHIPKGVPECPMLRNHNIIAIMFSPIDFKKRLSRRDTDERFHLSTNQNKVKNFTKAPWGDRDRKVWPH